MSWLELMKQNRIPQTDCGCEFSEKLKKYLLESSSLGYDEITAQQTVSSVMSLDDDLKDYVKTFILKGENRWAQLKSIPLSSDFSDEIDGEEFFSATGYSPVTAALYFQSLRNDRLTGQKHFLLNDIIK